MSSNSLWITEGGDLGTADWGCLVGRCASLCLQAVHGGRAAGGLVSDESALEACACSRLCAIQIDDLYLYWVCYAGCPQNCVEPPLAVGYLNESHACVMMAWFGCFA